MTGVEAAVVAAGFTFFGITVRELPGIILDKVFLRKHKNGASSTNGSVNGNGLSHASRSDVKEVLEYTLKADVIPLLQGQTQILQSLAATSSDLSKVSTQMVTILQERRPRRK